jgi:hypothetical protein
VLAPKRFGTGKQIAGSQATCSENEPVHPRSCVACRELIDEGNGKTPCCGFLFPHRENRQFIQGSFFFELTALIRAAMMTCKQN